MRIAVDISVLEQEISGVGRVLIGLYDACVRLDPTLEVVGIHRGRRPLGCELPPYFQDIHGCGLLPRRVWGEYVFPRYVRREQPDVLHFPFNKMAGAIRGKSLKVLTIHDLIPLALPDLYLRTDEDRHRYLARMRRSSNRADMVLTDSEASKHDIIEHLKPRSEPIVIYPGSCFAVAAQRNSAQSLEMGSHFIYLGGYDSRKGIKQLVRVYRELFRLKHVNGPLVFVGKPNHDIEPGLGGDIAAGTKEGAIVEKGYVADEEVVRLLKSATALIYPSRYEGFGLPALEAMSVGCPVVTTNVSSLPEVCGDAALYFEPGNDEELSQAIKTLESDGDLRMALRERGLVQAKKFSWERSARIYLEALDGALSIRGKC